jgi:hypothetical protein
MRSTRRTAAVEGTMSNTNAQDERNRILLSVALTVLVNLLLLLFSGGGSGVGL